MEVEGDEATIDAQRNAFFQEIPHLMQYFQPIQKKDELDISTSIASHNQKDNIKNTRLESNVNAFINNKGFDSEIDRSLGVIYYMDQQENVSFVNTPMLRERMQQARLNVPKNISAIFHLLTKKGYVQPEYHEETKLTNYYLTNEGKEYIDNYEKRERRNRNNTKKTTSHSTSNYSFLTKEMMRLDRYPEFSKMRYTKEKIMLIMYIMKDIHKGEYFTVNDLKYIITHIFNAKISESSIKTVFRNKDSARYFDKRHVNGSKRYVEYKMIPSGFHYFIDNVLNS